MQQEPFFTEIQRRDKEITLSAELDNSQWENITQPSELYAIFKRYTAELYFNDLLSEYAERAIVDDDYELIKGELQQINKIREHKLLKDPATKSLLYKEGVNILSAYNKGGEVPVSDNETRLLMIYLLHLNGYFNNVLMPDYCIDFATADLGDEIGLVYAQYFLMYEYFSKRLLELEKSIKPPQAIGNNATTPCNRQETFEELFYEARRKDGTYRKIIELLSKEPSIDIKKSCGISNDDPFISIVDGKIYWNYTWSYLAGLYDVCRNKKWIKNAAKSYRSSVSLSFEIAGIGKTAFEKMKDGTLDKKYSKPFELLFRML